MIEVLFGESEAASMKAAKNKIIVGAVNGPVSVWLAGKKTPPQKSFGGWIEGTSEEVICLGFNMVQRCPLFQMRSVQPVPDIKGVRQPDIGS